MSQISSSFSYFYKYLGNRLIAVVLLSFAVGILDGLGLSMFLPLMQVVGGEAGVDSDDLGKLSFVLHLVERFGWKLTISSLLLVMTGFFIMKGLLSFFQYFYRVKLQENFVREIRLETLWLLNEMSYKAFLTTSGGRIQNTLTGEVDRVSKAFQSYFLAFQCGIMVLVYLVFAMVVNPQFAILVTIGGSITNLVYQRIYKATKGTSRILSETTDQYQGLVIQHVGGFKYLKATGMLHRYAKKLTEMVGSIQRTNVRIGMLMSFLISAREPLVIGVVAIVIYAQVTVFGSAISSILVSLLFFYRALSFLMQLQTHANHYLSVSGSVSNIIEFQQYLKSHKEENHEGIKPSFQNSLELRNATVFFGKRLALQNMSLSIRKNEVLAIVGESGSGKTTLINVLSGMITLDSGTYLIDGVNRDRIDIQAFRERIGYITQDPVIFNDSVFNNITFWDAPVPKNRERFEDCLKRSAATQFVNQLEGREDHILLAGGGNLSGGQKQRISIARELYKSADILIFDEATSALDSVTENEIQENLEQLRGDYTILIVAHRLSTVKFADRIALLSGGKIASVGKFEELLAVSDEFNRIVRLQQLSNV